MAFLVKINKIDLSLYYLLQQRIRPCLATADLYNSCFVVNFSFILPQIVHCDTLRRRNIKFMVLFH